MCGTASQTCPLPVVVMVVVMVLVQCATPTVAYSAHSHATHAIDQREVLLAITVNQMALLQEMNASSTVCASREGELRELRLLKEAAVEQLNGMKEEAKGELEGMKDAVMEQLEEMKGETKSELQELVKEMVETKMEKVLEAVRNSSLVLPSHQPSQEPPQQPSHQPDLIDFHAPHNDTNPSRCGPSKVLYGSRGSLSPSHPGRYNSYMYCIWQVILPEGTRPVFTWEYFDLETCNACVCDFVLVTAPGVVELPALCESNIPDTHPMYSITANQFIVVFASDGSREGRGFLLHYEAQEVPQLPA